MTFPTRRQIFALVSYGVKPGLTSEICHRMLQFIKVFPATYPSERKKRAKKLRELQDEYVGKKIIFEGGREGVILAVWPEKIRLRGTTFAARVQWSDSLRSSTVIIQRLFDC